MYFVKDSNYARLFIGIFVILNIVAELLFRLLSTTALRHLRKRGYNQHHILLVGYGRTAEGYIDRILSHPEWGYVVHGILDNGKRNGKSYRNVQIIGNIDDLEGILTNHTYDEIAITLGIDQYDQLESIVSVTERFGIHTKFIPDYNNIIPTIPYTEDLDGLPIIHVRNVPLTNSFNKFVKRSMDIVGSIFCIILFSLPMLIISILIKLTSPGPLIFKQERDGLHAKPFMMYKFRSMRVNDGQDTAWSTQQDSRKTAFGTFIRKYSLDEFPQFWNVLKGDMSVVGPRPHMLAHTEQYSQLIDEYMVRHFVKPGVTGWAQVTGYRGETKELWQMEGRVKRDIWYMEHWSIWLDLRIIWMTFKTIFVHDKNAY